MNFRKKATAKSEAAEQGVGKSGERHIWMVRTVPNGAKQELQSVGIIPLLKSSDIYASHKMEEKCLETIQGIKSTLTKNERRAK
jgi:hypothetical protein